MTAELLSTWWPTAAAAGVGVAGLIVGIVGLVQARRARAAAAAASTAAQVATTIAEEANGVARDATAISKDTAARADEQHDVAWTWNFDPEDAGAVTVQNIGGHPAHAVSIQFSYQDITEAAKAASIESGAVVRFSIPGLRDDIARERQRRMNVVNAAVDPDFVGSITWAPDFRRTRLRVRWRTGLGTAKAFDSHWSTTTTLPL